MFEQENTTPVVEGGGALMPDGWGEGVDIFSEETWTAERQTDAPAKQPAQGLEGTMEELIAAPTTEQAKTPGEAAKAGAAPTTEPVQAAPNKLKFKARVDREDLDVELDEGELPAVYQKAQVADRYRARLDKVTPQAEELQRTAQSMGYEDPMAFLASVKEEWQRSEVRRLVGEGVHEEVAKDMVGRKFVPKQEVAAQEAPTAGKAPTRDFAAEVAMLKAARPELVSRQLPTEVLRACTDEKNPKHLMVAYAEYELAQQKAEADKLRHENEVLRQNAASAIRAPVSGVSGGGATDTEPEDDFMKGFGKGW